MTRHRGISRRRLAQGAGGLLAASALLPAAKAASATGHAGASEVAGTTVRATAVHAEPAAEPEQATDLTIRWLNVTPRLERDNLIGAWPCDEGSGYAVNDISGHGYTFHITGSEWNSTDSGLTGAFRRKGRRGGGLHMNGTRWLWAAPADGLNIRPRLSITAWVRPDNLPSSDPARILAHRGAYGLDVMPDGAVRFSVRAENGTPFKVTTDPGTLAVGRWTHVAGTSDASTGQLTVYVNGVRANSAKVDPFTPATSGDGLVAGLRLDGGLDEITLHNTPLDEATVRELYLVGLPKLYPQTRETIDPSSEVWTRYKGSEPIPHPIESDVVFTARFDGTTRAEQGQEPTDPGEAGFVPGAFGAALDLRQHAITYASPLIGADGTFEAWLLPAIDDADPDRQAHKVIFRATGQSGELVLATKDGRWQLTVERADGTSKTVQGPQQTFMPDVLEHVAATWGRHDLGEQTIALHVNGVQVAKQTVDGLDTVYDDQIVIGGTADAPAHVAVDDVSIANQARGWGGVCPRGHVATDAAGLDLRDGFDRPDGTAPVLWAGGSETGLWTYRTRDWEDPSGTGDDPDQRRSLYQATASGMHAAYHPDAYGHASSIEAGISFPEAMDGWAGVFVQSSGPGNAFDGHIFVINPTSNQLRMARYVDGAVVDAKRLSYDFPMAANTTYELTLTSSGDGVLRGFVDGNNLISMRLDPTSSIEGYAGLFTDEARACFDDVHFTALTPAATRSRLVQTRVFGTGGELGYDRLAVEPFRWHKRPGLPPDLHVQKKPEHPGNIAGADTSVPARPIPPAYWRAEDSANSDLVTVDGRVVFFMRGNYQNEKGESAGGHIGVLDTTPDKFDGVHFDDPSQSTDLDECKLLRGRIDRSPEHMRVHERFAVNDEASAYVGDGKLLVFVKEIRKKEGTPSYRRLAFDYYDVRENDWKYGVARYVEWSEMDPTEMDAKFHGIEGTPELVALRDPDTDAYNVLLYHRAETPEGHQVMGISGLRMDADGLPLLDRRWPTVRSISRLKYKKKGIYSFRVLFDNGIYYLHYAEGERVPDWPTHFVLGATLDPYTGPWMVNPDTDGEPDQPGYFRRGGEYAPDNGAIWQGTMFKHRGRYYMYYENFHAIEDNNQPYQHYDQRHTGSRVGFATAN